MDDFGNRYRGMLIFLIILTASMAAGLFLFKPSEFEIEFTIIRLRDMGEEPDNICPRCGMDEDNLIDAHYSTQDDTYFHKCKWCGKKWKLVHKHPLRGPAGHSYDSH